MDTCLLHPQLQADTHLVGHFPLSWLLLHKDARYPWCILVPKRPSVTEIFQLSPADQAALWQESSYLSRVLYQLFTPDKLNIAALGNMVPQLHLHHVVRYKQDAAWPKPIWGAAEAEDYSEAALTERLQRLRQALAEGGLSLT